MLSMYNVLTGAEAPAADATRIVTVTASTLTVTQAAHSGKIVMLNRAAGIGVTMPPATGTGAIFTFFIGIAITTNTTTFTKGASSDVFSGLAELSETAGPLTTIFLSAANTNLITLDGSIKGGLIGDMISFVDVATNRMMVRLQCAASGVIVTPFSNA